MLRRRIPPGASPLPLPLVKDGEEIQVDAPILLPLIGNLHPPAGAVDLAGDVPLLHCVCPGDGFRLVGEGEVAGLGKGNLIGDPVNVTVPSAAIDRLADLLGGFRIGLGAQSLDPVIPGGVRRLGHFLHPWQRTRSSVERISWSISGICALVKVMACPLVSTSAGMRKVSTTAKGVPTDTSWR